MTTRALLFVSAVVLWLTYLFTSIFFAVPHCNFLQVVPTTRGGPLPTPNADLIAARLAACNQPRPETLIVFGVGVGVILAVAWYIRHEDTMRGHELAQATSIGVFGGMAATLVLAVLLSYASAPPPAPTPAEGYWCWQSPTSPAPHQSRLADEYPCSQEEVNYYIHGTGPSPRSSLGPSLPPGTPILPGQLPGS